MVRHTGFKAVSTGRGYATLSNYWLRPWRKLVADLIRNPEVQGRGGRHTGFKAVSTERGYATLSNYWLRPWRKLVADLIRNPEGWRLGIQQDNTTTYSPSPLMGEESKSLSQCLTRDQRVKARQSHIPVPVDTALKPV